MSEQETKHSGAVKTAPKVNPQIEKDSMQILNSIITEMNTHNYPNTRFGTIADVRKGPEYDTTKERALVISFADGYVYMLEREAPEWVTKMSKSELIGQEIGFKPISVSGNRIFVSSRFVTDMYRLAMERKDTLRGTIISSFYDRENSDASYLMISCYGDVVKMMLRDHSIFGTTRYLPVLHNQKIAFRVINVTDEGEVLVSAAAIEAERRDKIIEELKEHPESVLAKITKVTASCAYLQYKGVPLILRNRDFSTDYTPVGMVKHKEDSMLVRLCNISERKRIFVEPVQKYVTPAGLTPKFEKGQNATGIVTGVSSWGIFVRVAPGIDAVCAIPETRVPAREDKVMIKITKVGERRDRSGQKQPSIKGAILSIIREEDTEEPKPAVEE